MIANGHIAQEEIYEQLVAGSAPFRALIERHRLDVAAT